MNNAPDAKKARVHGTVRDQYQRPLAGATVEVYEVGLRSQQLLCKAGTNDQGAYDVDYRRAQSDDSAAATATHAPNIVVKLLGKEGAVLSTSSTYFNAAAELQVDIDLSGRAWPGPSELTTTLAAVRPFVGDLPLAQLTEDKQHQDVSFLTSKSSIASTIVEALVIAARLESQTKIALAAWYGLVRLGPSAHPIGQAAATNALADLPSQATQIFGALMRETIDALMAGIQSAIDANTIAYAVTAELPALRRSLLDQQQQYLKAQPGASQSPQLSMKLNIAGLQGDQVTSFTKLFTSSDVTQQSFWTTLSKDPSFQQQKTGLLQSVFSLARLTGEQILLTDQLIQANGITTPDQLGLLAANTAQDWAGILDKNKIEPPAGVPGQSAAERTQNYATQLEQAFVGAFPSAAFTARIQKDAQSLIPNAGTIANFLKANPTFDLVATRIGAFLSAQGKPASAPAAPAATTAAAPAGKPAAASAPAAPAALSAEQATLADQLRRTQRVLKLAPTYEAANTLMGDGVDSARKIYRMGQSRFIARYGAKLGVSAAQRIFRKAKQTHAQALAMVGNFKSMSDAAQLNVFPDYTGMLSSALTLEVPDLDTLFGHTDYCECDECRSVYGAAAYLTDMLHYLEARLTTITCAPGETASVKEALLRRRPDIGDIDLECNNVNTTLPYIDIVNELLEDTIASPTITIAAANLAKLVAGTIDAALASTISTGFNSAGQINYAPLLTTAATVSDKYVVERLKDDDTCVKETHWIIRDQYLVLRATDNGASGIELRILHETLLSSDEINANPEYVNILAHDNFIKTARRPFSLPFDLFETEAELYLAKLGTAKPDLIAAFAIEHDASVPPTAAALAIAYAYLGINLAEQTLIFVADTANPTLYWGNLAASSQVELDLFMNYTGLDYPTVLQLLSEYTINPAKDSLIDNQDLSCDLNKKLITNVTPAKLDIIHRFLRLWKKTSLSLDELDGVVQAKALGNGLITSSLAWQLRPLLLLMQRWSLSAFQLLAFYGNLDTTHPNDLYEQLFQNRQATNPLNADFAIASVTAGTLAISDVHKGIITGALGLQPSDLALLIAGTDGKLSLANLSYFYRVAQLAQALQLAVSDVFRINALINVAPFTDPVTTAHYYTKWQTFMTSQLAVSDLDYVLRHNDNPASPLIASDDLVAQALADLQSKLLLAEANAAVVFDPKGQLLSKWLNDPMLSWNGAIAAKLLALLSIQDDATYQTAVDNQQQFLLDLRVQYHDQTLTADLSALPAGVTLPDSLATSFASQISYDATNRQLVLIGYMSAADQTALNALSADAGFQAAVNQLYGAAQQTSSAAPNVIFATVSDINTQLRTILSANLANRYQLLLSAISPVYLQLQQQQALQAELCSWFKINKDVASAILGSKPAIFSDYTQAAFVHKQATLTAANFPQPFAWYQHIAKICFLVTKLKLTAVDLTFFLAHAGDVGALDLWSLPIQPQSGPATTFDAFEVLIQILTFEQKYPAVQQVTATTTATVSVYSVLLDTVSHAAIGTVETDLASLTGWDKTELDQLINAPNYLHLTADDLKSIRILWRLDTCFTVSSSLGAQAADCVNWCNPSLSWADSTKIKQALKAHNEGSQWLSVTQPLQNQLREKKRDALVAWSLTNPLSGQTWQTSDDLYSYFLIDVEMTSCQPTSRIVQATNSVQQFVQRCFLNLEPNITVDTTVDADWTQWQWMKNFRLWQANVEVFLWPENWIDPTLLPSELKSSFLSDLQSDLLQNDVTNDNVESALLTYLDKLDQVARLEVKAMWYEDEKQILHVVGRTYGGDPRTYFYRQLVQGRRWTPWVKIDQDVASDHIVLTVFNNRIYLFWAMFSEQSYEVTTVSVPNAGDSSFAPDKPSKYWQIQMAFSEYKNGKWTPKIVSSNDDSGSLYVDQWFDDSSNTYQPDKSEFLFTPLDIPLIDCSQFFDSSGRPRDTSTFLQTILKGVQGVISDNGDLRINCYLCQSGDTPEYEGTFDLDPCKGYPIVTDDYAQLNMTLFDRSQMTNMLDTEQYDGNPDTLAINSVAITDETPGTFANLISTQMGFIDRFLFIILELYYCLTRVDEARATTFESVREGISVNVGTFLPYFYQDKSYTYFVQPEISDNNTFEFTYQDLEALFLAVIEGDTTTLQQILATFPPQGTSLSVMQHFYNFFHPQVCLFMRTLFDQGIDAFMSRETQLVNDVIFGPQPPTFDFNQTFQPTGLVFSGQPVTYTRTDGTTATDQYPGYPKSDVDFDPQAGYSCYNWELFFHAPLMIAEQLDQNLQFEDADHWYKYIFNPTDGSSYPSPDKYWNTKPFFINVNDKYTAQNINNIVLGIDQGDQQLVQDVTDWRNNPFQPHYIAQYRTVAYQKATVMAYLNHLIAWADNLFQQDTMESVAEATQLYVLANQILGPQPQIIPPAYVPPVRNYNQLGQLDALSNAIVDIENLLPLQEVDGFDPGGAGKGLPNLETLYFCIPPNSQLLSYWTTVANRLYNIRHCLNLQGVYAPLALFAPPINPGLLVRAAAAGLDIGSVLTDLNAPLPAYRFASIMQKAVEVCNEVKGLGLALLGVMEKQDAENLSLLKSSDSIALLNAVLQVKQQQVQESNHNLEALQQQQAVVQIRINYYTALMSAGLNNWETGSLSLVQSAISGETAAVAIEYLGNVMAMIPDFNLGASGFGGSPHAAAKFGGQQLGDAMRAMAGAIRGNAGIAHSQANVMSTQATFQRRAQEWQHQLDLANAEFQQIGKQILAAEIRQTVATMEVTNQQLQITNAQSEDAFMRSKFTNNELYAWQIGQVSTFYFQSYQLAYALAKQAEQTYRYELGLADSSYITFGYWDTLHKGLLAGDVLMLSIRTLDKAYHDQNLREYELTKHVSLMQLDPSALQMLKTNKECWFNLPEELFDMDFPGHYLRRLRNVSVTIPCVVGPYTSMSATLSQTSNSMRVTNTATGSANYPRKVVSGVPADDPRFRDQVGATAAIAVSTAQNDAGLFDSNLRDERYLPFEGSGAISQWHLQLPAPLPQFDYSTITDVIVHVKYTAREGGDQLRSDAGTSLKTRINSMLVSLKDTGLTRLFSARHEFPTEWYAFLNPASATADQELDLKLDPSRFPYFAAASTILIKSVELVANSTLSSISGITVTPAPLNASPLTLSQDDVYGSMLRLVLDYSTSAKPTGTWVIKNPAAKPRITADQIKDLIVLVHYQVS